MKDQEPPLADLRFALVGAGAVGSTLAGWLVARGATLTAVAVRAGSKRGVALARQCRARTESLESLDSASDDLLLIAVPDAAIPAVAAQLARHPQARVTLHVAGALGASALSPLAAAGSEIGTFHPLRAFAAGSPDSEPGGGTFYALDGMPGAVALARRIAGAFEGVAAIVEEGARPLYHLIATLLAGGLTTVAAAAFELRRASGVPAAADPGYARLATDALAAALEAADPAAGITGPAARGDLATFVGEAQALSATAPDLLPIVVALARETLRQRSRLGPLTEAQNELRRALEAPDLLDRSGVRVLTFPPGHDS